MENSEVIQISVIIVCSEEMNKSDYGISFDGKEPKRISMRSCGIKQNIELKKGKTTKVRLLRRTLKDMQMVWDKGHAEREYDFEDGLIYRIEIISDNSGKKEIDISIYDPEAVGALHNHIDMK